MILQGCLKPVTVKIPPNTILSPSAEAAVVGGNVLTSQRVTDVILKAFNAAAASQVHTPSFVLYRRPSCSFHLRRYTESVIASTPQMQA